MNQRHLTRRRLAAILSIAALLAAPATAQQEPAVPRLANGKPDFTGVWDHPRVGDITQSSDGDVCAGGSQGCSQAGSGPLPFTALGREIRAQNDTDYFDYGAHCLPWGFVRAYGTPYPHAYVHSPERLAILWEQDNAWHMVPTDGRALPEDLEATWRGTSVGHWQGDTLVIETAGFNGRTWLDTARNPHSDALRLTLRLSRPEYDRMIFEITIEDPKYYTEPFTNSRTFALMAPGQELFEYSCTENNRCEGGDCAPADVQQQSH
jgi:hypothetical protein